MADKNLSSLKLSKAASTLAQNRGDGWEHRLFCQVVEDELANSKDLKRRYNLGIAMGRGERVSAAQLESWNGLRMTELRKRLSRLSMLSPSVAVT